MRTPDLTRPSTLAASRARVALAWAAATFVLLATLAGGPGISRDEASVLAATAGVPAATVDEGEGGARVAAPLAPAAAKASHAVFSRLGVGHLRAARLPTAFLGGVLSAALVLLAWELAGPAAALLAPALFWAAPRHLHAGLVATPDLALAALLVATVAAYRRAAVDRDGRRRLRAAIAAGLLFGAALTARTDAWVLLPALALHAAVARLAPPRAAPPSPGAETRARTVPPALVAMAALGPVVLAVAWPSLLWTAAAPARVAAAFTQGAVAAWDYLGEPLTGRLPATYPFVVTALALPVTLLLAYAAGAGHALLRIAGALRDRARGPADEVLLLVCAAAPLAAAAAGIAPAVAGVRPWLHAMPFLAMLGARALLTAARIAWPARAAPLAASLALLAVYPAARAAGHVHPAGASAWNELAGGAPGAASLGMQRQDGGEAAAAVLALVNARARPGARIWWPSTAPAALRLWARGGLLRADLGEAEGPDDADLAVVTLDGASRDLEYRAWTAFGTARPAAGAYLDEVPLAFVYARAGAWR